MKPQLSLFESDAKASLPGELFFALRPDAETAGRISKLAQQLHQGNGIKRAVISEDRFHVTLHHIGTYEDLPDSIVSAARQAAESVKAASFSVGFTKAFSFAGKPDRVPSVLGMKIENAELLALHKALTQALTLAGFWRWLKPTFTPHLTLFYDRAIPEQAIAPIGWRAREFVLLYSQPGKGHECLGSWPLTEQ